MKDLNPDKLNVDFKDSVEIDKLIIPRKYTLTHSDFTAKLFLTIGSEYDYKKISKLMRDEVLAEWQKKNSHYELHLYLHVSGTFTYLWAGLRDKIFRSYLPMVFQAFRYGDTKLFEEMPEIENSQIIVHFQSKKKKYDKIENFGQIKDIRY